MIGSGIPMIHNSKPRPICVLPSCFVVETETPGKPQKFLLSACTPGCGRAARRKAPIEIQERIATAGSGIEPRREREELAHHMPEHVPIVGVGDGMGDAGQLDQMAFAVGKLLV